ncbi:hypothetical protein BDQ12DRAFT_721720 [Crucibulum laeve]|uniref:Uncharacterized protein n=1 Tax=Crucibulum laeve TaxID=68775 RepID=A0A5C3MGI0_9AGAR|nr:hypothetical protein BDQ12DRAFT_721720 [Crucibulum laeve]
MVFQQRPSISLVDIDDFSAQLTAALDSISLAEPFNFPDHERRDKASSDSVQLSNFRSPPAALVPNPDPPCLNLQRGSVAGHVETSLLDPLPLTRWTNSSALLSPTTTPKKSTNIMSRLRNSKSLSTLDPDAVSSNCLGVGFPSSHPISSISSPSTRPSVFAKIKRLATRSRSGSRTRAHAAPPQPPPPIPTLAFQPPSSIGSSSMHSREISTNEDGDISYHPSASSPIPSPSYSIRSNATTMSMSSTSTRSTATEPHSPMTPLSPNFAAQQDIYRPWLDYADDTYPQHPYTLQYRGTGAELFTRRESLRAPIQGRASLGSPPVRSKRPRTRSNPTTPPPFVSQPLDDSRDSHKLGQSFAALPWIKRRPSSLAPSKPPPSGPLPSVPNLPTLSSRRGSYYTRRPEYLSRRRYNEYSTGDDYAYDTYAYYDSYFSSDLDDPDQPRTRRECGGIREMRERKETFRGETTIGRRQIQRDTHTNDKQDSEEDGIDGEWTLFLGVGSDSPLKPPPLIISQRSKSESEQSDTAPTSKDWKRHSLSTSASMPFLRGDDRRKRVQSEIARPAVDVKSHKVDKNEEKGKQAKKTRTIEDWTLSLPLPAPAGRRKSMLPIVVIDDSIDNQASLAASRSQRSLKLDSSVLFCAPASSSQLSSPVSPVSCTSPPIVQKEVKKQLPFAPTSIRPALERLPSNSSMKTVASHLSVASSMSVRSRASTSSNTSSSEASNPKKVSSATLPAQSRESLYSTSSASFYSVSSASMYSMSSYASTATLSKRRLPITSTTRVSQPPAPATAPPSRPIPPLPATSVVPIVSTIDDAHIVSTSPEAQKRSTRNTSMYVPPSTSSSISSTFSTLSTLSASSRLSTASTSSTATIIPSSSQRFHIQEMEEERQQLERGLMAIGQSRISFAPDEWEYETVEDAFTGVRNTNYDNADAESMDSSSYYSARSSFNL